MRTLASLAFASLLLFAGCDEKDQATPRLPAGPQDVGGQEYHFKVKAEEWEQYGTPGDDIQGYSIIKDVYILTDALAQNGTVRVYLGRGAGNWTELPLLAHQGAPGGYNWNFTYRAGSVRIFIDRNGEMFDAPDQVSSFKVVVFGGQ